MKRIATFRWRKARSARCFGELLAGGCGCRLVEQLLERLDLQQEQAQIEKHVDDLGARHEITATETLERFVDHLSELLLVHVTTSVAQQPIGSPFRSWI